MATGESKNVYFAATTPTPVEPKTVLHSTDSQALARRLRAVSRISQQLTHWTREDELAGEFLAQLLIAFENADVAELVVIHPAPKFGVRYTQQRGVKLRGMNLRALDRLASRATRGVIGGRMATLPLVVSNHLVGILVLNASAGCTFSSGDVDTLTGVAAQAAIALQNLQSTGKLEEKRQLSVDLGTARRIQRSFLPSLSKLPIDLAGFQIAAEYRPIFAVGGDFYDVIARRPGVLTATVGDVSGKGVSGALMMARATTEMRRLVPLARSPGELLKRFNEYSFAGHTPDDVFVSATVVEVDSRRLTLTVANAGHVPPYVRRASGAVTVMGSASGPPIGMATDLDYSDEVFPLQPDDIIILMTDGVVEALHRDHDPLGGVSLRDVIGRSPHDPRAINRNILDAVARAGPSAVQDDVALLTIKIARTR